MDDRIGTIARGTAQDRGEPVNLAGGYDDGASGPALPLGPGDEPLRIEDVDLPAGSAAQGTARPAPVEPGRALALADFAPPTLGAGERLLRMAYRMGLAGARNPFRRRTRPRLLATAIDPLAGDAAAGTALRAGHFLIHGVKAPIADMEFSGPRLSPPFERVVHGFGWLADLEASAPRQQGSPVAERVLAAWLNANPKPDGSPAWDVGHAGHRLMGWLLHAPLLMGGPDKALRARMLDAMDETALWLDRNVARARDKLAEVAGWCGIVSAGLLLSDGRARQLYGEAGLVTALGDLLGDDGGLLSRSPLGQIEAIGLLVRLRAAYAALRQDMPEQLEAILELMVPPLLGLVHTDGGLASFQGAGAIEAERIDALVAASQVRTRPLREARQWGYQRVANRRAVLLMDAAPPPHPRQTRDGCASTLAFELSHDGQRVIVNCGGASFAGAQIPARLAQGLRATAAHSTLTINDLNSTAVLINGKLGAGVAAVDMDRRAVPSDSGVGMTRLEASHDGYAARYGLLHRRILLLRDDGGELRGEDLLVPTGRKGKKGTIAVALRFHLAPGVEIAPGGDGRGATLGLPDGSIWQFRSGAESLSVEDSIWADGQGRAIPTRQLVIQAKVPRSGERFAWILKKMR